LPLCKKKGHYYYWLKVETSGSIHDFTWKQRLICANKIWTGNAGFETQQSFKKEKKSPSRSP
jgi:hypothetical protein